MDDVHSKVSEELLSDCPVEQGIKCGKCTEYMWNLELSFR